MSVPPIVIHDFLAFFDLTGEFMRPVLRGGVLLRHWFGDLSRPVSDLDLECFHVPYTEEYLNQLREDYEDDELQLDGFGPWGEYTSLVDYGKAMCRYSAESSHWQQTGRAPIEFVEAKLEDWETSLWVYGTPGERYKVGWQLSGEPGFLGRVFGRGKRKTLLELTEGQENGAFTIDVAAAGDYACEDIGVETVELSNSLGKSVSVEAYSQETMLAAKLSWLLRGLERQTQSGQTETGRAAAPKWHGEPKDLYDAYLILARGNVDAAGFQKALDGFSRNDDIQWSSLAALAVDVPQLTPDEQVDVKNWNEFAVEHAERINHLTGQPVEVSNANWFLQQTAAMLTPLLGPYYVAEEEPFVNDIAASSDFAKDACLVYADWLEERGDERAEHLRLIVAALHGGTRLGLGERVRDAPHGWLERMSGSTMRCRELLAGI